MTPDEFKTRMAEFYDAADKDVEYQHIKADKLMCELLRSLGYGDGVDVFDKEQRWYA